MLSVNQGGKYLKSFRMAFTEGVDMKKSDFNVPNALSISRLIFLPLLYIFIIKEMNILFLTGYIILGSTDYFDGLIARRFNQKTEIGKTLDSLSDIFFYVSTAWFIYRLYPAYLEPNNILLVMFFAIFFASFVISAVKLHKPVMMHTFLLKLNGVLVYFLVIGSFFFDTTIFISGILTIYLVGFAEEIMIFMKYGDVDPDTLSYFFLAGREQLADAALIESGNKKGFV